MNRALALLVPVVLLGCSGRPEPTPAPAPRAAPAAGPCEHRVPAAVCTRCNPELAPVFRSKGDWCEEHGVPESQCLACNPKLAVAEPAQDWCGEHGLPESRCTKCNPALVATFIAAGDYCREHGFPASACPICQGKTAFPPPGMKVRLASAAAATEAGIATTRVQRRAFGATLDVVGVLGLDPNRTAEPTSTGDAVVREVHVDVGDVVAAGDPLVTLASARIGEDRAALSAARSRTAAARAALERKRLLEEDGIAARAEVEAATRELAEAEAAEAAARAALGAAGAGAGAGGTLTLRAPFAGTVAARDAVVGRAVPAGEAPVRVADLSTVWALLEIPGDRAAAVRPGQAVAVTVEGLHEPRAAAIAAVAPTVDPRTRTVRARVVLENPDGALKAGAFVRASIGIGGDREALVIPRAAVQRGEGNRVVFVPEEAGVYRPVAVALGESVGAEVEVLSGLEEGALVVTTGAFLLATETRKDAIGAGCCDPVQESSGRDRSRDDRRAEPNQAGRLSREARVRESDGPSPGRNPDGPTEVE